MLTTKWLLQIIQYHIWLTFYFGYDYTDYRNKNYGFRQLALNQNKLVHPFNQMGQNKIVQSTIKGQPSMQVAADLTECLVVGSPLAYTATKDSKTELAL